MDDEAAVKLGREILDGTYVPGSMAQCERGLTLDRNPHSVRLTQFILFAKPGQKVRSPDPPAYLILQQAPARVANQPHAMMERVIKPLSERLGDEILKDENQPHSIPDRLPDPADAHTDVGRLRTFAVDRRIPGYTPDWTERDLRAGVGRWIQTTVRGRLRQRLEPFERAGFPVTRSLTGDLKDLRATIADILKPILLPEPYEPFETAHPHFGLCATFEQVWEPKGYTRGEVINTISLAPGEQLTVEIHTWDKRTSRSEEELLAESEMQVVENLTQRDVRTVSREVAKNFSSSMTASGGIPIPSGTASATAAYSVNSRVNQTDEQVRERTVQASNTLKTTRKVRIEVSREIGRERKQTHTISNTNRCHTLNCHYFEVMANYLVTTRLVKVDPCLLVPAVPGEVTPEWILCHEALLKETLLSETYLPGFEAARVLATHETFKEVKLSAENESLDLYAATIATIFDDLMAAVEAVKDLSASELVAAAHAAGGAYGEAFTTAALTTADQLRKMIYMGMIATNTVAYNAMVGFRGDFALGSANALRKLFAVVSPKAYRVNVTVALHTGFSLLGFSAATGHGLMAWGFTHRIPNDGGLYNAVKIASAKLKALDAPGEGAAEPDHAYSFIEVAKAEVAYEQLKSHIEDNWIHYAHAMWLRESANERFNRLQGYGSVASVLENEILGFLGHKVAFRLVNPEAVADQIDFVALGGAVALDERAPLLVTVPTQGTIMEAAIGQCDACEDFIQESRIIDLKVQHANAAKAEAETRRLQMRLDAVPPDLSEPGLASGNKVTVTVGGGTNPPHPPE